MPQNITRCASEPILHADPHAALFEGCAGDTITSRQRFFPRCYGPEFAGRLLEQWAYLNKVELDFSRPGKPTDNAYIEAFNGRLRQECLNASWFLSMDDARTRINNWRTDYNETRR